MLLQLLERRTNKMLTSIAANDGFDDGGKRGQQLLRVLKHNLTFNVRVTID